MTQPDQLAALKRIAHELRAADRELREDLERYDAEHAARVKKVEAVSEKEVSS